MNIIFISYVYWPPDFGGELLMALGRLESLVKRGHGIRVLTSGKPGFLAREYKRGFDIWRSPMIGERRWQRGLRRIMFWIWGLWMLARLDYDVLHLGSIPGFGPGSTALMAWSLTAIAKLRSKRSLTVHALADKEDAALDLHGLKRFWKQLHFTNLNHVVAVSPGLYEPLKEFVGEKAMMIVYGVRDDIFKPLSSDKRETIRMTEGVLPGSMVFTFLGSVGYRKGFDLLARAFADLATNHSDWWLWVIGPYLQSENQNLNKDEVDKVIEPLQEVSKQVKFWGRIDERQQLAQILGAGDIFVFPSRREGFGIAPLEAMASGVPVIVARIPGITDIGSIENETGLYVRPGITEDLKVAMLKLGLNVQLRHSMGVKARQRIEQNFGWKQHVDAWESLYMSI